MKLCVKPARSYIKFAQVDQNRADISIGIKTFNERIQLLRKTLNPQIKGINKVIEIRDQINALMKDKEINESVAEPLKRAFWEANQMLGKLVGEKQDDPAQIEQVVGALQKAIDDFQSVNPANAGAAGAGAAGAGTAATPAATPAATTPGQVPPMQGDPNQWLQGTVGALPSLTDPAMLSNMSVQIDQMIPKATTTAWTQALTSARQQVAQRLQSIQDTTGTTTDPSGQQAFNWAQPATPGATPPATPSATPPATTPGVTPPVAPDGAGTVANPNAQPKGRRPAMEWLGNQLGRARNIPTNMRNNFQKGYQGARQTATPAPATAKSKPQLTAMMGSSAKYRFSQR